MEHNIGDVVTLPNNTTAEIVEIKPKTNQWGIAIGGFEYWGKIISSDSDIVGEVHLVNTCSD